MKKFKNNNSKPPKDSQVEQQINNDKLSPMKQLQNLEIPENLSNYIYIRKVFFFFFKNCIKF